MKKKAIGLLSGGLDSTLAVRMMIDQGIDVVAVNFISPFCNCTSKHSSCKNEALRVCKEFGIRFRAGVMGEDFLEYVVKPRFGYGRNMNPCLDCRVLMFKKSREIMSEEGASFIFTGEVLGQRPMSQRRNAMEIVEKESGLAGLILRPLSARIFAPTIPEKEGIIDREKLLSISGRSRKQQIALAEELHIGDYPCPAGGCLLTDAGFSAKLKDVISAKGTLKMEDVRLLKVGRHFRLDNGIKIIVGRDERENNKLFNFMSPDETVFEVVEYGSPILIVEGELDRESIYTAAGIAVRYSSAPREGRVEVRYKRKGDPEYSSVFAETVSEETLAGIKIC